jgi:putative AlgH/UPF0301 family transcriptional regulator
MSRLKLYFYVTLATLLIFAAAEELNRHLKESAPPEMDRLADGPALAAGFPAKNQTPPGDLHRVQFKNAKSLGLGKVLVASRNLGDPHFVKTVILLVQYDAKGVLGLMLNRRTNIPISRALEGVKAAKDRSDPVYIGGPVETPAVFALLQSPAKIEGAEPIFDHVYFIAAKPLFEQTISARPAPDVFHIYLGYAGWTQEQLQKEVELGAWFVFPPETNAVFNSDPDSLWQEMIHKTELEMALGQSVSPSPAI